MSVTTIKRMPDDRMPLGESYAYIGSVQIVTLSSKMGTQFDAVQLELHVLYKPFNMTVKKVVTVPIFWYDESTFVKMLRSFGILPEIGEDIDLGVLVHKIVRIKVGEKMKDGKVFRNVEDVTPFVGKPHPLLQKLLDAHAEARQKTETLFDDEVDSGEDEEEKGEDDCSTGVDDRFDRTVQSEVSEDEVEDEAVKVPPKKPPRKPNVPLGIVKRKLDGQQNGSKPASSASHHFDDEDEELGDF